jgi:hypothetical protein
VAHEPHEQLAQIFDSPALVAAVTHLSGTAVPFEGVV